MSNLEIISPEQQHSLNDLRIAIVGNNPIGELIVANLVGIGVQTIYYFGERTGEMIFGETSSQLQKHFTRLSPETNIYGESSRFKKQQLRGLGIDIIVDCSSSLEEKISASKAELPIVQLFRGSEILVNCNTSPMFDTLPKVTGSDAGVLAGLIADECRKARLQLSTYDTPARRIIYRFEDSYPGLNVLAIGAGGLGNFFSIAAKKHQIKLVDYDLFEARNTHRQPFCEIGRSKAVVLSERFKNITPCLDKFDKQLIKRFESENYMPDVVVGCVDNVTTRREIFEYSARRKIPYFDGGVGPTSGQIKKSIEPKGVDLEEGKSNSCAVVRNPSIVISNCIIGTQLALSLKHINSKKYRFYYDALHPARVKEYYE